ncbi:TlpA family protein disulfide reductase [Terrimonas sp. NA20]|uniref:TlpA family protein disulfide reductase n=1 Tax=Terrimonas ginsenosidimutans TaxID=2908004 RepID=A0ABS9KYY2_9BACT|nr:TlpA disulfide reductase family protein [Terrimonas ginsenosidimutans]MCG2617523.1 TlpA family protein disulfide reductase [Terrimonas ginsenosidimutans]
MRGKYLLLACICLSVITNTEAQHTKSVKITDLEKTIAESNTPLIINFWATYCIPCIAEMPAFEKLAAKYKNKGVKLLFVSLDMQDDYPAKVDSFIKKRKIQNPTVWLDETNADYFCPKVDPKWSGAIPATLFIHTKKNYRRFFEKEFSEEELEKEIMAILR